MINQPEGALRIYSEEDFYRLFSREIQRATRYQDFLSLCLVRPDHSGPPSAGFLDAVAYRVVELLRSTDLVGMFDDTIAVLLVHTPDSDAALIMERLRGRVETQPLRVVSGEPDVMPTLSLGLASFPTDATGDGSLFAHARARLNEAWEARRRSPQTP
jgi:GGDEF domain-containing protein